MGKLTGKQELFCREFIADLNATQAAIRAGYKKRSAHSIGAENLAKPQIAERIKELMREREIRLQLTVDGVVKRINDVANAANAEGDHNSELKALEMLMKHLGGYERDNRQKQGEVIVVGVPKEFEAVQD